MYVTSNIYFIQQDITCLYCFLVRYVRLVRDTALNNSFV